MFDLSIIDNDISILNVEKEDLNYISSWMNSKSIFRNPEILNVNFVRERYIEACVSESEIFLKILKDDKFIGMVKGRIEFKEKNEVWFMYFDIENEVMSQTANRSLESLMKCFSNLYGINRFMVVIPEKHKRLLRFYKENNFKIYRLIRDFNYYGDRNGNSIVLKFEY